MSKSLKTIEDLSAAIKVPGGVVVDFGAKWCGPCRAINPVFDELSKKYTKVAFYKVDIEEASEMVEMLQISGVPTFIMFYGGKQVAAFAGASATRLTEEVMKLQLLGNN